MKKKTILVIGILGILLVFGAALALAQNTSSEKTNIAENNHECTPEMMTNMPENCPENMMQSGACENMMNGTKDCNEMMGNEKPAGANIPGESHCGDMDSDMGSMMGSGGTDMKVQKDMM